MPQGAERKRLVQTVSDWLGVPAKYCGAPSFNYEVDYFTIDRSGSLSFDDRADSEVIERLLEHLYDEGFDIDQSHTEDEGEPCAVCISMPRSLFTDSNLENLKALIAAKGGLIKKALGVADLPLEITDTKVSFPWFPATPTPDEMNAYDTFICKLCEMARNQSRVNSSVSAHQGADEAGAGTAHCPRGHPVLRWMMDNIFIRTDPAGNIKPDKEKSTEKIDGAVATIMALDRAIRCGNDTAESVYDSRGLLFI